MFRNCEKMVVMISSTTNKWAQNHIDEKELMALTGRSMEKPSLEREQEQRQQQLVQALKCPRCDSSNTKFCYYNNYSLSQPRHFCNACKRYWTRGGTLRNIPVGGGCRRKNKRVKRPVAAIDGAKASPASGVYPNLQSQTQTTDVSSNSSHDDLNPLFYGLANNPSDANLPFPRFVSIVSGVETVTGYDLQPQLNAFGLGFSSNRTKQIQESVASNPLLSSYSNMFGSSSSSTTTTPTIASLLASSLHQHKFTNGGARNNTQGPNNFQALASLQDLQMRGNSENGLMTKDVKVEEAQSRMEWINLPCQNQLDQIGLSVPAVYWNATSVGAWHDPANMSPHSLL